MFGKNKSKESEKLFADKRLEILNSIMAELKSGSSLKSTRQKLLEIYSKDLVDEVVENFSKEAIRHESDELLSKYGTVQKQEIDLSYFGPTMESIIVAGAAILILLIIVYVLLFLILAASGVK